MSANPVGRPRIQQDDDDTDIQNLKQIIMEALQGQDSILKVKDRAANRMTIILDNGTFSVFDIMIKNTFRED